RGADVPRRAGDGRRDGRGAGIGEEPAVGAGRGAGGSGEGRGSMKTIACSLLLALALGAQQQPPAGAPGRGQGRGGRGGGGLQVTPIEESGFHSIFDGKTMTGWDCDPDFWRVEGEALVGQTAAGHQPKQNIFCIWRDGSPGDFELKMQYKLTGADTGNSGIQYRSVELPEVARWVLKGYQADIDAQQ